MNFKFVLIVVLFGESFASSSTSGGESTDKLRALFSLPACRLKPIDCSDIQKNNYSPTGVYSIFPYQTQEIRVRCDMDSTTGGWTVIQRRTTDFDFYKNWETYKNGFGNVNTGDFWLGNDNIHRIISQGRYELRIDLTASNGETAYAEYREFAISNEKQGYRLYVRGYSGTAGDSLTYHSEMKFSTFDRDNDLHSGKCAVQFHGAWWYKTCHLSNLNGDYGNTNYAIGPVWKTWKGYHSPMKKTEMKIRRIISMN